MGTPDFADDAILIVIDLINDVVLPGEEFHLGSARDLVPGVRDLLDASRRRGVPIVHAASQGMGNSLVDRHWWQVANNVSLIEGSNGVEVVDSLRPERYTDAEVYLPKPKYSCFYGTKLDILLRNPPFRGRNTIMITGMNTNLCCLCTAIDAFNRDYDVVFIDDLNCTMDGIDGTPAETMHRITVETLKQGFVREVIDSAEALSRLRPVDVLTA